MKLENLKKAKELMCELDKFKKALDLLGNYDATVQCVIGSGHNGNTKRYEEVRIPPVITKGGLKDIIESKITDIEKQLSEL